MEKDFRNQHFAIRLGANKVRNKRVHREPAQTNRSLLINTKSSENETASASGEA